MLPMIATLAVCVGCPGNSGGNAGGKSELSEEEIAASNMNESLKDELEQLNVLQRKIVKAQNEQDFESLLPAAQALFDWNKKQESPDEEFGVLCGDAFLLCGAFENAVASYELTRKAAPQMSPTLWTRGVALVALEQYEPAIEQFEAYSKATKYDTENSVWHFLAVAKNTDVSTARKSVIDAEKDLRGQLKGLDDVMRGEKDIESHLSKVERGPDTLDALVAVAVYYRAIGDDSSAKEFINRAATRGETGYYRQSLAIRLRDHWYGG
ncbi:MAG: hypothetical protein AAFP90_05560 [Planctomycetota bacterium]